MEMNQETPQLIIVALFILNLIAATLNHEKSIKINAYVTFISTCLHATILIWGGFFN